MVNRVRSGPIKRWIVAVGTNSSRPSRRKIGVVRSLDVRGRGLILGIGFLVTAPCVVLGGGRARVRRPATCVVGLTSRHR